MSAGVMMVCQRTGSPRGLNYVAPKNTDTATQANVRVVNRRMLAPAHAETFTPPPEPDT